MATGVDAAAARTTSSVPSSEPSSTTMTSNAAGSYCCLTMCSRVRARIGARLKVATTTLTLGSVGTAAPGRMLGQPGYCPGETLGQQHLRPITQHIDRPTAVDRVILNGEQDAAHVEAGGQRRRDQAGDRMEHREGRLQGRSRNRNDHGRPTAKGDEAVDDFALGVNLTIADIEALSRGSRRRLGEQQRLDPIIDVEAAQAPATTAGQILDTLSAPLCEQLGGRRKALP